MSKIYDLVIIGGGAGGLVVASAASQLKAKVALIEKDKLGGDCLWYGCVPSKSLIHASRVAYQVKNAPNFGINTHITNIDFAKVHDYVHRVIKEIEPYDSPERFRGLGVEVIFGSGSFGDRQTFKVNGRQLKARNFVISTGSRPAIPMIKGLEEVGYLTNEQIFSVRKLPESIGIIGAGPIGCELGQALARLGVKVTIIASKNQILPKEDPQAALVIQTQLESEGIKFIKNTRAEKVQLVNSKKNIFTKNEIIIVDEILMAIGRKPNIETLDLEAAGVKYSKESIIVNEKLQTTNNRIYACGDVIGGYQFTHVASFEATVVLQNTLFFPTKKIDYRVIPWATFTEPELAKVGLSEQEAIELYGNNICILQQNFAEVDRARAESAKVGFAKIITTKKGKILGATLVGISAGELIHEIVLAMKNNLPVSALTGIHIYPTLSEINSKTALLLTKQNYAKNKLLQTILTQFFRFRRWLGK